MFEIEKGIKIPTGRGKYPFHLMGIGDSFCVKKAKGDIPGDVRCSAYTYGKRHGMKFTTKSEDDGVRVWRIE